MRSIASLRIRVRCLVVLAGFTVTFYGHDQCAPRINVLSKYASARRFLRALPLSLFEQPENRVFFSTLQG